MSEPTGVPAMYPGRPVSMRTGRGANQSDRQATECENGNKDGRWHCLLSTLDEQPRQRGRRKVVPRQLGKARTAGCRHGLKWRSSQTQPQSSQRAHFIAHGGPRMPARIGAPRPDRRSASTARGRSPRSHPATKREHQSNPDQDFYSGNRRAQTNTALDALGLEVDRVEVHRNPPAHFDHGLAVVRRWLRRPAPSG